MFNRVSLVFSLLVVLLSACGGEQKGLPRAPTNVVASPENNAIKITWKDNSTNETSFVIYREELNPTSLQSLAFEKLLDKPANSKEHLDTSIDINKTYRYSVTAKNAEGENPKDPMLTATQAVQATPRDGFRLSIVRSGSGSGKISSSPAGIDCDYETGSGCDFVFPKESKVTLTVSAGDDSEFAGWEGVAACSGKGSCTVSMNASKAIPVVLLRTKATLRIDKSMGTGQGRVTSIPQGIDCGVICSFSWQTPIEVVITAVADEASQSRFLEWQGCPKTEGARGQFCRIRQELPGLVQVGATFMLPAPVISSFTADKDKVAANAPAVLSWVVEDSGNTDVSLSLTALPTGATVPQIIDLSAKALSDSITVNPALSTTYTLSAKSESGNDEKTQIISVGDATTISFTATDTDPEDGTEAIDVTPTDTVKLSWDIAGEAPFSLSLSKLSEAGTTPISVTGKGAKDSLDVVPGVSSSYTLTAVNSLGLASSATLVIEVGAAPVIPDFVVEGGDTTPSSGSTVKLNWTVSSTAEIIRQSLTENVTTVPLSAAARTVSRSLSTPTDTPTAFTYGLSATNRFGSSPKKTLELTVGKPALLTAFSAENPTLALGTLVKLNWGATGSEPLTFTIRRGATVLATVSGGVRTATVAGSEISETVTYSIVADNVYGPSTAPLTTLVSFGEVPAISSFTLLVTGDPLDDVELAWELDFKGGAEPGLSLIRTNPGGGTTTIPALPSSPGGVTDTDLPPGDYSYTLVAKNIFGESAPSIRNVTIE